MMVRPIKDGLFKRSSLTTVSVNYYLYIKLYSLHHPNFTEHTILVRPTYFVILSLLDMTKLSNKSEHVGEPKFKR